MKAGSKKGFHKGSFGSATLEQRQRSMAAVMRARKYAIGHIMKKHKLSTPAEINSKGLEAELQRVFKERAKTERKKIAKPSRQRRDEEQRA